MAEKERTYSTWGRPFRLQLSVSSASGFAAPASRGRCQSEEGCSLFEWRSGARYCRACWLRVYGQDRLPDRGHGYE